MSIKHKLNDIQLKLFNLFIITSYILIILSFLGLYDYAPNILSNIDYYVRIYICLFLIWRFNPLRSYIEFNELDRKIAFSAGLFILTTTFLGDMIAHFISNIKNTI